MDANSTASTRSRSRRFRDQPQEMARKDSPEASVGSDTSSISGNVELQPELTSMTGKGIGRLCSELLELKKASEEDFQQNIFSSYSAFVSVFKEMGGTEVQLMQLRHHVSTQKMLVKDFKEEIYLKITLDETAKSISKEPSFPESSPAGMLMSHTESVTEILDTLILEYKLDEALDILEMEVETFQNMQFQENLPLEIWKSHESAILERKIMLADEFKLLASNPRVRAAELQKALVGLCRLGDNDVVTQLLLNYYHLRISSGINDLQLSETYPYGVYILGIAKFVFSSISQAAKSFKVLHGETSPYPPEFMQWAYQETEVFANCFSKYVSCITETSSGLSTAAEALEYALSYCSLLEPQRILLQSCLIDYLRPCIVDVLQIQFSHFKKVMKIFTSTDAWVLGRYPSSGILTGQSSAVVAGEDLEYCLLTNSGRKFVTMLQTIKEDTSTLVILQMEGSVLKGLMDLFTEYTVILESSLDDKEYDGAKEVDSSINSAESLVQQVSVIANLSTLVNIFSGIVRSIFIDSSHLEFEIDSYILFVQEACSRLRADLCEQFIQRIMSIEIDYRLTPNECAWTQDDSDSSSDIMPSVPYQVLYAELRKLEKLAEENFNEDWLMDYLRDLVEAMFVWISRNEETWKIPRDSDDKNYGYMKQFVLDIQFLVEVARCGGYLTNIIVTDSFDIISRMQSLFVSADLDPNRSRIDYDWAVNAAAKAVQRLLEIEQTKLNPNDTNDDSGSEVQETENANLDSDESSDHLEVLNGQDVLCLRDFLEDEDDDEAISNSEYYVESVEDSDTKETSSVPPDTELPYSSMVVADINEVIDTLPINTERNSSGKTISLIEVVRNDLFNDAKIDTKGAEKCSEDNTDMQT
ncbi:Exocyst complex subunit [Heracleum sosnowskyi]|uniref:Exocyst complex subunit n=1 Tax=Heracleum sosnowskyi TaxID=360622 RepID=A0AAD8LWL6_9APIA|nr:Exocyst complex subunit [Heracleum sosnowskyi]